MDGWIDICAIRHRSPCSPCKWQQYPPVSVSLIVDVDSIKLSSFSNSRVAGGIFGYTK